MFYFSWVQWVVHPLHSLYGNKQKKIYNHFSKKGVVGMSYFVRHKLGKNTNWDKFAHIFRDLGLSSWKVYFMNIFRQYRTWLANDYSERINRFHWTNRTWADSWETANTSVNNLDDDSDWSWHIWHKPETIWSYWGVSGVAGFDFAWQRLSYLLNCLKSARSYSEDATKCILRHGNYDLPRGMQFKKLQRCR